jgi:rhomboid protease GluP
MKNRATLSLVALNVIAYIWETTTGGLASNRSLYDHGALCRLCVTQDGQWWRIYSSAFLHGGLAHIALNMFALVQIGTLRMGARGKSLISQMLPVVGLNLAFTFAVPFISKEEHIGGLISGFLAGLVFFFTRQSHEPVVVDTQTGETATAEYLAPDEPNGPPHAVGLP